jgi:hypothetical protein
VKEETMVLSKCKMGSVEFPGDKMFTCHMDIQFSAAGVYLPRSM